MLFIHSSFVGHLGFCYVLAVVNSVAMNRGIQISLQISAFNSFGYISRRELLDHVVILCLIFGGNTILFSTVAAPFYIPTSNAQGFQTLHILANKSYFLFYLFACLPVF